MAWVHLAVLWSFAFAQPLLDLLGDNPEFFAARGSSGLVGCPNANRVAKQIPAVQ